MTGNLIGEQFDTYVFDQIRARQELNNVGFGSKLKSPNQIQLQNNKNSFLKLASGVNFYNPSIIPTEKEFQDQAGSGVLNDEDYEIVIPYRPVLSERGKEKYKLISEQIKENNKLQLSEAKTKLKNLGFSEAQIKQYGNEETLAKQAILFGGLGKLSNGKISQRSGISFSNNIWNNTSAYGLGGNQFGKQPMPGITSAKIDCINRGSIRSATIQLKAYNTFQFQLIEILYLRLGFTMMLEWGFNKYVDNSGSLREVENTIIEDIFFNNQGYSQLELLKKIETYRRKYSGNYDGFFGRVTNFNWDFSPDGIYNITLKLTTLGDVIESLQLNLPAPIKSFKANADGETTADTTLEQWLDDEVKADTENKAVWGNGKYINLKSINYKKPPSFDYTDTNKRGSKDQRKKQAEEKYQQMLKENPGLSGKLGIIDGLTKENSYFVTFGELLSKIYNNILPKVENKEAVPILAMGLDENLNVVSAQPNQISFDLNVCFVKPQIYVNGVTVPSIFRSNWIKEFFVIEKEGNEDLFYGKLMNIYLNFSFIKKLLKRNISKDNELSLFNFLEGICDGINSSLGSVNKIEPIINAEKNEIVFIDQNPIKGNDLIIKKLLSKSPDPLDVVPFEIFGFNSSNNQSNFVKSFNFATKIDSNLASMITIGTTAGGSTTKVTDGTAFSKWNAGLQDRFQKKIVLPSEFKTPAEREQDNENNKQEVIQEELTAWWGETKPFNNGQGKAGTNRNAASYVAKEDEAASQANKDSGNKLIWDKNQSGKQYARNGGYKILSTKSGKYKGYSFQNDSLQDFISGYISWKQGVGLNVLTQDDIDLSSSYQSWLIYAFSGIIIGKVNEQSNPFTVTPGEALYLNVANSTFFSQGKKAFKEYIRLRDQKIYRLTGNPSNQQGFIPVELSLTLNGISGVKLYQKLNINQKFLPPEYISSALTNTIDFVIQKVNHQIVDEKWETQLVTISIPPTKIENFELIDDGLFSFLGLDQSSPLVISGDRSINGTAQRFPANQLTPSNFIRQKLKKSEALRLKAYDDPGANDGKPITIGYGQTFYTPGQQYTRIPNTVQIQAGANPQGELFTYNGSFGRNSLSEIKLGDTITEESANKGFNDVVTNFGKNMVDPKRIQVPLTQNEYDALLHFSYNTGYGVSEDKKPLYNFINSKDYVSAGYQLEKTIPGTKDKPTLLQSRRMTEADIWFTDNPGNPTS